MCLRLSVAAFTRKRRDARFDLWLCKVKKNSKNQKQLILECWRCCSVGRSRCWIMVVKVKVVFLYSAVSIPLDRSKRFTLFASPGRPVHSDTNSASPGSILARQKLRAKAYISTTVYTIAKYSFIQLSEQGRQWRERKCPIFETVTKRDSNPGSLGCESSILLLSYRTQWRIQGGFLVARKPPPPRP